MISIFLFYRTYSLKDIISLILLWLAPPVAFIEGMNSKLFNFKNLLKFMRITIWILLFYLLYTLHSMPFILNARPYVVQVSIFIIYCSIETYAIIALGERSAISIVSFIAGLVLLTLTGSRNALINDCIISVSSFWTAA